MAIYHLLYRTTVAGRIPTAANMPSGRLGLNLTDERIYFTNASGNVVEPQPRPHTHTVSDITNLNAQLLPTTAHDLNSYSTQSEWVQTSQAGADAGTNYPIALPGFLEVIANSSTSVLQRFSTFTTAQTTRRMFFRTKGTGSWTNWVETPTNYGSLAYLGAVPDASDLNTFLDRGIWQIANSTTAAGGTNFPAPYSGYLIVLSTAVQGSGATITSGVTQLYYAANTNVSYTRSLVNGTWTDWGGNSAATVLTTQNLNDVVGAGTYYMNSDATATAILNYPVELAGVLEVVRAPSGNMQVMQRYTTRNATNTRIFVRNRFSTSLTWFPWLEITSLIPQSSTVDTTAGRAMIVGAFGLGAWAPNLTTYGFGNDFNLIDTRTCHVTVDQNMINGPLGTGSAAYTALLRVQRRQFIAGTAVTQEVFMQDGSIWTRAGTGEIGSTTWTSWAKTLTSTSGAQAYNHVYLSVATDANTMIDENTYYSWGNVAVMTGGNWPPVAAAGGVMTVYRVTSNASNVIQTLQLNVGASKRPIVLRRSGAGTAGSLVWKDWQVVEPISRTADLPTGDC